MHLLTSRVDRIDTFGAFRSRDIEPTEEYGSLFLDTVASCLRVLASNAGTGARGCMHTNETCCDIEGTRDHKPVWSLATWQNKTDFLLTDSAEEEQILTCPGEPWREICVAVARSQTDFCYDARTAASEDAMRGPFYVHIKPGANRLPLYRCVSDSAGVHFFATNAECDGLGIHERVLGYIATARNSDMARSLRRCRATDSGVVGRRAFAGTHFYHSLDGDCPLGRQPILGYVF